MGQIHGEVVAACYQVWIPWLDDESERFGYQKQTNKTFDSILHNNLVYEALPNLL